MKKRAYSSPEAVVVRIQSVQLLAGSPMLGGDYGGGTVLAPAEDFFESDNDESLTRMLLSE